MSPLRIDGLSLNGWGFGCAGGEAVVWGVSNSNIASKNKVSCLMRKPVFRISDQV